MLLRGLCLWGRSTAGVAHGLTDVSHWWWHASVQSASTAAADADYMLAAPKPEATLQQHGPAVYSVMLHQPTGNIAPTLSCCSLCCCAGWALAVVSSRAFRVAGPQAPAALLPLIDMANHSFEPNCEVLPVPGGVAMVAKRPVRCCRCRWLVLFWCVSSAVCLTQHSTPQHGAVNNGAAVDSDMLCPALSASHSTVKACHSMV